MSICLHCAACGHSWYDWNDRPVPADPKSFDSTPCIYCRLVQAGNLSIVRQSADGDGRRAPETLPLLKSDADALRAQALSALAGAALDPASARLLSDILRILDSAAARQAKASGAKA